MEHLGSGQESGELLAGASQSHRPDVLLVQIRQAGRKAPSVLLITEFINEAQGLSLLTTEDTSIGEGTDVFRSSCDPQPQP